MGCNFFSLSASTGCVAGVNSEEKELSNLDELRVEVLDTEKELDLLVCFDHVVGRFPNVGVCIRGLKKSCWRLS